MAKTEHRKSHGKQTKNFIKAVAKNEEIRLGGNQYFLKILERISFLYEMVFRKSLL